jgi:phage head maturation protease
VWAVLRFFDTPEGWRAFLRAKDGELDAASIGFMPVEERVGADGAREHVEAELHHVCLLATADGAVPSYDAPRILETRRAALPDVSALLAVTYDVALAEDCVDPAVLARMADRG